MFRRLTGPQACVICTLIVVALAGCEVSIGRGVATPTATVASDASGCAQLPAFATAHWVDIPNTDFPATGVEVATVTSPAQAVFQVVRYEACLPDARTQQPNGTPVPTSAVAQALAALNLDSRGWVGSPTFPFDGTHQEACGSGRLCYQGTPLNYLLLQHVVDYAQRLISFEVLLASNQPLVQCDPNLFPFDVYPSTISLMWAARIPLPPLTRTSMGYGSGAGDVTAFLCSDGTASSIMAYMMHQMPVFGWKAQTVGSAQVWTITTTGAPKLYARINPVIDPKKWSITEYQAS